MDEIAGEDGTSYLDDVWSMYYHDPADRDWTMTSYRKLSTLSCAEEFWGLQDLLSPVLSRGMFFLMREHVFPCWDDPENIRGGCLTMKVPSADVPAAWERMCSEALTEGLRGLGPVNGVSLSPKGGHSILKLWLGDTTAADAGRRPPWLRAAMFLLNLDSLHAAARKQRPQPGQARPA